MGYRVVLDDNSGNEVIVKVIVEDGFSASEYIQTPPNSNEADQVPPGGIGAQAPNCTPSTHGLL